MISSIIENRQRRTVDRGSAGQVFHRHYRLLIRSLLLAWGLVAASAQAVEFPGPISLRQDGASLSAQRVRLPGADRDYFVSGSSEGFLNLNKYNPASESYTVLHRFAILGRITAIVPWLGRAGQEAGLVVATLDPDRVVFVDVNGSFPFLSTVAAVPLEEDPGEIAFVGNTTTGPWEMAVSLPGIDQVAFLTEDNGVWALSGTIDSGDRPSSLVGVDLDGDNILELVVANTGPLSGTLGIFRR
ncbi:MAG: hypothetical protein DRQ54_11205, partial [Gammaproteobacteria bacterium]